METQKAIELIADILDVLVGGLTPECGEEFIPEHGSWNDENDISCGSACEFYHQCKQMSRARNLSSELQGLLSGEEWI